PYAVQESYGGPQKLKELVNACHNYGIAVFLDVVYNHLGPEGNYFGKFGPYFTDKYKTPWGEALNFDGEWSDGVREYFVENALHWFENYHLDGLRLDAIHAVIDCGAVPVWQLMSGRVQELSEKLGRPLHLVAESDLNSPRVVKNTEAGGMGFEAQWLDDFHHALYVLLDEKGRDRYIDFGEMEQLAKAYSDGFVHSGEYVKFRKRKHGASSAGIPGNRFVVFNQNHDQVGNRVKGERLSRLVNFERLKLAAAAVLLAPYVPLLFMGEEYAEDNPFLYFVSHSDKTLIAAVRQGRKQEFAGFGSTTNLPDPQAEETFTQCKLQWEKRRQGKHQVILNWHRHLIQLRKSNPVLQQFAKTDCRVTCLGQEGLALHRQTPNGKEHLLCLFSFSEKTIAFSFPGHAANWQKILDSKDREWLEPDAAPSGKKPANKVKAGTEIKIPPLSVLVYSNT
ncbi:MAG TPA: alpha-amylase family glycosyl hydrolase, partial [Adhaeribacter sp.]|nr:alpha-amylase family glycosyl hydrolase [Adhaeribacter sp.]